MGWDGMHLVINKIGDIGDTLKIALYALALIGELELKNANIRKLLGIVGSLNNKASLKPYLPI